MYVCVCVYIYIHIDRACRIILYKQGGAQVFSAKFALRSSLGSFALASEGPLLPSRSTSMASHGLLQSHPGLGISIWSAVEIPGRLMLVLREDAHCLGIFFSYLVGAERCCSAQNASENAWIASVDSMMFVLLESLNMFKSCYYSMLINCKALVRSLDQHLFRKKHRNDHFQRLRDA